MKSSLILLVALVLALFVVGCARRYNVTMSSGRIITSKGKPRYDKANSVFVFKDMRGEERRIPAGSVSSVAPASAKTTSAGFNPQPTR